MDTRTGEIRQLTEAEAVTLKTRGAKALAFESHLVEVQDADIKKLEKMPKHKRKNWMRNRPCMCGSGEKFKKCCWNNYT